MEQFEKGDYPLVILDVRLNCKLSGIELLKRFIQSRPQTAVIIITAHGTVETAVEAMRAGAFDFILKPVDLNLVRQQVRKARQHYDLQQENLALRHRLAGLGELSNIIAGGAAMEDVFRQIRQVAATEATVMIHGESGTGKELIARALHDLSDRSVGPFIAVNLVRCLSLFWKVNCLDMKKDPLVAPHAKSLAALSNPLEARSSWTKLRDVSQEPSRFASRLGNRRIHSRWWRGTIAVRCTHHLCNQSLGSRTYCRRPVPRGPLLSIECHPDRSSPAAQPS